MKIPTLSHTPLIRIITTFCVLLTVCVLIAPSGVMALEKPEAGTVKAKSLKPEGRPDKAVKGKKRGKDGRRGRGLNFKSLDTDTNGFLSFEEFSASERLARMEVQKRRRIFNYLDRNKDGKLQEKELKPHNQSWVKTMHEEFNRLDADKSGALDMSEFAQSRIMAQKDEDSRAKLFKRLDRDKDGLIQRSELRGQGRPRSRHDLDFKKYDTNDSGGLDFNEFSKLPFVGRLPDERRKKQFERIDTDNNGEISPDETRAVHNRHLRPPHRKNDRKPKRLPSQQSKN